MGARHYDPLLRTFLTQDPVTGGVGQPMTMSPYVYAFNSPTNYVDPDGRFACGGICIGAGLTWLAANAYAGTLVYQDTTGQELDHRQAAAVGAGSSAAVGAAIAAAPVAAGAAAWAVGAAGLDAASGFGAVLFGGLVSGATTGTAVVAGGVTSEYVGTGTVTAAPFRNGAIAAGLGFTAGAASAGVAAAGIAGWTGLAADASILLGEEVAFNAATGQDLLSPSSAFNLIGLGVGLRNQRRVSVEAASGRTSRVEVATSAADSQAVPEFLRKNLKSLPEGSFRVHGIVEQPGRGFLNDLALDVELVKPVRGTRVFGGGSSAQGPYVAFGRLPSSRRELRRRLALGTFRQPGESGSYNAITRIADAELGAGTRFTLGEVAPYRSPSGRLYGGGATQGFVPFWQASNRGLVEFTNVRRATRGALRRVGR